jgi:hypothetical protein
MKNFKTNALIFLQAKEYRNSYISIGLIAVASYYFIRELMTNMAAWAWVKTSPLTINMLLLFFFWGMYADKRWKYSSKYKRWAIMYGGGIIIIAILRYVGGIKTVLG